MSPMGSIMFFNCVLCWMNSMEWKRKAKGFKVSNPGLIINTANLCSCFPLCVLFYCRCRRRTLVMDTEEFLHPFSQSFFIQIMQIIQHTEKDKQASKREKFHRRKDNIFSFSMTKWWRRKKDGEWKKKKENRMP